MKRIFLVMLMGVLLLSCNSKKSSNEGLALLWMATHNYRVFTTLSLDSVGSVSSSNQSYSVSSSSSMMSMSALSPRLSSSVVSGEVLYITGKKDGIKVMLEVRNIDDNDVVRTVLFNKGSEIVNTPPSSTPTAFEIGGVKYILFYIPFVNAPDFNTFYLYEYESETEQTVQFKVSNAWDFSVITAFVQSRQIPHVVNLPTALIVSIDYNVTRNTLYFSLYENVKTSNNGIADGDTKGSYMPEIYGYGYAQKTFFQSTFNGTTFNTPSVVNGHINIYDASHFTDGLSHTVSDFPYVLYGLHQMIRMYTTKDGTKAYFTMTFTPYKNGNYCGPSMNQACGPEVNSSDPYFWPEPNYYSTADVTKTGSVVFSADIASDGTMNNIQQLPSNVNGGGMNMVTDISDDGSRIYIAKMDLVDENGTLIMEPNNLITYMCIRDVYDIPEWNGRIEIYQKNGSNWDNVGTIRQQ